MDNPKLSPTCSKCQGDMDRIQDTYICSDCGYTEPGYIEDIAKLCHEVSKAYCEALGDSSHDIWNDSPEWQKQSVRNGVKLHLKNNVTPKQSHESWLLEKANAGWKYGPIKDAEKKEHPCCVPYDELPVEQRAKDYIFKAICDNYEF